LITPSEITTSHGSAAAGEGPRSAVDEADLAEGLSRTAPRQPDHAIEDEGRTCTAAEYEQWLTETGFHQPRRVSLNVPGAKGLIIAEQP
jgi:hypothetical protein